MSLTNRVAKVYIYKHLFKGLPKHTDLELIEELLPPLKNGEYLAELVYLSAGPNPKVFAFKNQSTGTTYTGTQVARIVETQNAKYPVGQHVVADFGWRTLTIANDTSGAQLIPGTPDTPKSLALSILGLPGIAAYFGFLEICKPNKGDIVVISSAAGAIGSHVGQIAKLKGCKVIGITSTQEKCNWLLNDLHFDYVINYKTDNILEKLGEYAPDGVDCYFDNVGGAISSAVIYRIKQFGRICICGAISLYYNNVEPLAAEIETPIKIREATMEGMHVARWIDRWPEALEQNLKWYLEGKLKYKETITEGFENMLQALINTLQGKAIGKPLVHHKNK